MKLSFNSFFIKNASTNQLWNMSAEILTELSRRDGVDFRIKATEESYLNKINDLTQHL